MRKNICDTERGAETSLYTLAVRIWAINVLHPLDKLKTKLDGPQSL